MTGTHRRTIGGRLRFHVETILTGEVAMGCNCGKGKGKGGTGGK